MIVKLILLYFIVQSDGKELPDGGGYSHSCISNLNSRYTCYSPHKRCQGDTIFYKPKGFVVLDQY